jgi:hypothetical protein
MVDGNDLKVGESGKLWENLGIIFGVIQTFLSQWWIVELLVYRININ